MNGSSMDHVTASTTNEQGTPSFIAKQLFLFLYALIRLLGWGLWCILVAVLFMLRVLYRPVAFLLQPVIYFGRFLYACLILPFSLLARLETIYIYLGVAAIVGVLIGLFVNYLYGALSDLFHLNVQDSSSIRIRTAREYREAKQKERAAISVPLISPAAFSPTPLSPGHISPAYLSLSDGSRKGKRKGLLDQTIMEELDSDY